MHCLIISESAAFPWGMAATTRVRNIGKALVLQGVCVEYIGLHGSGTSYHKSKKRSGSVEGLKYCYPGGFAVRSKNWYLRRIDDFLGKWFSLIKIKQLVKQGSLEAVIIYSRNYKTVMFWSIKLKRMGIKVILELCEWPLANTLSNNFSIENAKKFCNHAIITVDAILPISRYIENEVKVIAKKNAKTIPTFRIPILTDFVFSSANEILKDCKGPEDYILYSGSINYLDIAYFIVDIIGALQNNGYKLKLLFTGSGEKHLFDQIRVYAKNSDVAEHIEFTGQVEEKKLFEYMTNALCLLAPLPETEQSKARFPTKIGYYLSSGRPVVTNAVGSVNEYLIDGKNAFIANNYEAGLFVEKIIAIVKSPEDANRIGVRGQQLAFEKFYYKNACTGLREFLEKSTVNQSDFHC